MTSLDLKSVDLNLLVVLNALLAEQSVTHAATRLGMSPPAVSQALGRLRRTLDDPLLVRAGRGMVPSPRALELAPVVEGLCRQLTDVFAPPPPFDPATSERELTVVGSDYVICVLGVELDRRVRDTAPSLRLHFVANRTDDAERIRDGRVDLAVGVYPDLPPEIRMVKLFDEELVVVARQDHPTVKQRLSLAQYCALEHVQIAPRGRPGGVVDDALAARDRARFVSRRVPFFFGGLVVAAQTDCLLTLPRRLAERWAGRFDLRVLSLPVPVDPYPLRMMWHPRHEADVGHAWLRDRVRESTAAKPRASP